MSFTPSLLYEIRDRFYYADECPYSGKRIYFENSGGSLTLKTAVQQSELISRVPDNEHRNNPASLAMTEIVNKGKQDLSHFFGHTSGVIFGGETGTECLFRLIRSAALALPKGGSIVSSPLEHPSTYNATQIWAENTGREWIEVPFDTQTGLVTAEDYARYVKPDTRIATIIHTNPVTGMVMNIAAISKTIREISPNCLIIADGIQHAPHGALDVEAYGVDAYVISMYKAYSKFNNGYAWVSERMSQIPHDKLLGKPMEAWELGSRDPSALAAASEVVSYLDWLGGHFTQKQDTRSRLNAAGKAMSAHERMLTQLIINGNQIHKGLMAYDSVKIIGDPKMSSHESVISFAIEGHDSEAVVAALAERGIRTHARLSDVYSGNILRPLGLESVTRVSVGHYNTEQEVLYFLEQFKHLFDHNN